MAISFTQSNAVKAIKDAINSLDNYNLSEEDTKNFKGTINHFHKGNYYNERSILPTIYLEWIKKTSKKTGYIVVKIKSDDEDKKPLMLSLRSISDIYSFRELLLLTERLKAKRIS